MMKSQQPRNASARVAVDAIFICAVWGECPLFRRAQKHTHARHATNQMIEMHAKRLARLLSSMICWKQWVHTAQTELLASFSEIILICAVCPPKCLSLMYIM